ncbi:MAG: transporter [Blastococcus sp.]|nr:transporter [Blastococcus sp.]
MTSADAGGRGGPWHRPVLAGAVANLAAGTLFGWSLVAQSVSDALTMSRGTAAAVFAAAIVVFAAVLLVLGPVQRRSGPRRLLRVAAAAGGGGLLLAATTQQPAVLLLGVAVLFGGANGLAYGVSLGLAARAPTSLRGTATGLVVAAYAAGPVLLGLVAPQALAAFGWRPSLACLAVAVAGLLTIAAELAPGDVPAGRRPSRPHSIPRRDVVLLWIVFAGGTAPGLMLFAHAVTVAGDRHLSAQAAGLAVSSLAAGNLIGRLSVGAWSDRIGRLPALALALATGALSIGAVAAPTSPQVVLAGFLGTGLAYGAVSALVPAATADRVGAAFFPTAYGVVFTGWGCAGLLAPLAGGRLIGLSEQTPALLSLAAAPLMAAAVAVLLLTDRARGPLRS